MSAVFLQKPCLHIAQIIHEAEEVGRTWRQFWQANIDLDKVRAWKAGVTKTLNDGLAGLVKQRKVNLIQGVGQFTSPETYVV